MISDHYADVGTDVLLLCVTTRGGLNTTSVQKQNKDGIPINYVMADERPLFGSWSLPPLSKLTLGTMLIPSILFLFFIV